MKNHYCPTEKEMYAKGSKCGPLQSDGYDYLCPDCGGYGYIADKNSKCDFCSGFGTIKLNDERVFEKKFCDDPTEGDETTEVSRLAL